MQEHGGALAAKQRKGDIRRAGIVGVADGIHAIDARHQALGLVHHNLAALDLGANVLGERGGLVRGDVDDEGVADDGVAG